MRILLYSAAAAALMAAGGISPANGSGSCKPGFEEPDYNDSICIGGMDVESDSLYYPEGEITEFVDSAAAESEIFWPAYSFEDWRKVYANFKKDVPELQQSESGLIYHIYDRGTGAEVASGSTIDLAYEGMFLDGEIFDAAMPDNPMKANVSRLIAGMTEGLQLLSEGGRAQLIIPYWLGYGESGAGDVIPPYAPLVFNVEVVKVY